MLTQEQEQTVKPTGITRLSGSGAGPSLLWFILPTVSFCSHRARKCVPSISGRSRGAEGLFLAKDDRERVHLVWREPLV